MCLGRVFSVDWLKIKEKSLLFLDKPGTTFPKKHIHSCENVKFH
jgi:hypothetical protein